MNYDVVHVTIHHYSHLANIGTSLQAKTLACPTKTRVGALNSSSPPKKLSFNWDHHPIFKHNMLEATSHNGGLYLVLYLHFWRFYRYTQVSLDFTIWTHQQTSSAQPLLLPPSRSSNTRSGAHNGAGVAGRCGAPQVASKICPRPAGGGAEGRCMPGAAGGGKKGTGGRFCLGAVDDVARWKWHYQEKTGWWIHWSLMDPISVAQNKGWEELRVRTCWRKTKHAKVKIWYNQCEDCDATPAFSAPVFWTTLVYSAVHEWARPITHT